MGLCSETCGIFVDQRLNPSPALAGGFFTTDTPEKPWTPLFSTWSLERTSQNSSYSQRMCSSDCHRGIAFAYFNILEVWGWRKRPNQWKHCLTRHMFKKKMTSPKWIDFFLPTPITAKQDLTAVLTLPRNVTHKTVNLNFWIKTVELTCAG